MCIGLPTSLASPKFINLICKMACTVGVSMELPFSVQWCDVSGSWVDFGFIDQIEIVARICGRMVSACAEDRIQFPVFGSGNLFLVQVEGGAMKLAVGCGNGQRSVRIINSNGFFDGCKLSFTAGAIGC